MHFTLNVLLQITPWLTSIGFSLCFGTIMAKMGRVFCIVHSSTSLKKYVCTLSSSIFFSYTSSIKTRIEAAKTYVLGS